MKTYFKQSCPVCGRPLFVPVDLLGYAASCSHCLGTFIARNQDEPSDRKLSKVWGLNESNQYDSHFELEVQRDDCNCLLGPSDNLCKSASK